MELYKPIAGAPAFMVSNFGNICSVDCFALCYKEVSNA